MRGQSPPPAWSSTCARARRRRTRRRGQSSRSSRPDVPTDPPKSSTREASPHHTPTPARPPTALWKPATHLPSLSRLCTHRERRCPSFQFNYKQKQTNKHCSKTVFVGSVAMEWGGLKGMDENHTHTHHILRTAWGVAGTLASTPPTSPRFQQEGSQYLSQRRHLSLITHTQLSLLVLLSSLLVS